MSEFLHGLPPLLTDNAIVLVAVLPLLASAVAALIPNRKVAWGWTVLITMAVTFCAIVLAMQVGLNGVQSYHLGGWVPPLGIEFRVDALGAGVLVLVSSMATLASIAGLSLVEAQVRAEKQPLFYSAFLICLAGLIGVTATGDAFNLFVFLEISSISTYVLVALGGNHDRRAFPAAFNYLVMGTIGATFFVIGVGFLYAATGTLNMMDMADRLQSLGDSRVVQAGFAFIFVGLGLKLAMFPLHQWLPGAYAYAPSFVTVFLSATATKVALYALIRFTFTVFDPDFAFLQAAFQYVLAPMAVVAILACSMQAIFQDDIRRLLAFSSVAQIGYMLMGVSTGTVEGISASLFHMINHAVVKAALFIGLGFVVIKYGGATVNEFQGLRKRAPLLSIAFVVAGFSLIGMPGTAGFMSKLALLNAALASGWWWAALIIAGASILAILYLGRILLAILFQPAHEEAGRSEAPVSLLIPLAILTFFAFYFFFDTSLPMQFANSAANTLLSGGVL